MAILTDAHINFLRDALAKLLGNPAEGTMAYVRCLTPDIITQLCAPEPLQIPHWEVYVVTGSEAQGERFITADQAVDLREEKKGNVLLLVDQKKADVGMDGIYSAVREIGEQELFHIAINIVRTQLPKHIQEFVHAAYQRARHLGRVNTISPWREFDFYARCALKPEASGEYIALLGLWPMQVGNEFRKEDLEISAQIVERLLIPAGTTDTARARIESLLLHAEAEAQGNELEKFLRGVSDLRWTDAAVKACEYPSLWVGTLEPGFVRQELKSIELVSWRSRRGAAPSNWSGLKVVNSQLVFLIDEQDREKSKLEVRWKILPKNLKAGTVEYKVAIITGSDNELVGRQVTHSGKEQQRYVFTGEDFEELDEGGKWEVKVRVYLVGADAPEAGEVSPLWKESDDFILSFGTKNTTAQSSVGKKGRALVEEAIKLSEEEFDTACRLPLSEDAQGYVSYRVNGNSGRTYRPPLIKEVEEDWQQREFQIGRWVVRLRTEGSRAGSCEFLPIESDNRDVDIWRKVRDATRQMGQKAMERCGFIGFIHHGNDAATNYVNAWASALEAGGPQLALANTIEIQSLLCKTMGLIVLPSHPLRIAWHQAYDELAYHARYHEALKPTEVIRTLKSLDGSYVPAFLPGLTKGASFVFGDTLGFYAVAMIRHDEAEPQATIAQMVRCLSSTRDDVAPSVGITTASAIAREIDKYTNLHPQYTSLHINALRPGDGQTVAQALGLALNTKGEEEDGDGDNTLEKPGYMLDLFPSREAANSRVVGRFLSETAERRRVGAGAVPEEERWMLRTYEAAGITLPRLKWAKRSTSEPQEPAHLSIAFDTFDSTVESCTEEEIGGARPMEAFGLIPSVTRRFSFDPVPTWTKTLAGQVEGEKHPAGRILSERLLKIQNAVMRSVAANLSDNQSSWPVLKTSLTAGQVDSIRRLHELSDWVITVDRNAGIEYFDAPREASDVYETYVIDCVPERQDLDCVQLITSTSKIEEVMRLLDRTLADMALSCSPRNCNFLLSQLKAISGRLAMRLANRGQSRGELIALSLFYSNCALSEGSKNWLSLENGFLVPLDDVRDLLLEDEKEKATASQDGEQETQGRQRADLMYVDVSRRGTLQFAFIEVKYRRLQKSALDASLHTHIYEQTSRTRKRWLENYFSDKLTQTQRAIRRKRLGRALQFYLDKARRHRLSEQAYKRLSLAIDRLFRSDTELATESTEDRGYIFCPEYDGVAKEIDALGNTRLYIFGPKGMPDTTAPGRANGGKVPAEAMERPQSTLPNESPPLVLLR